MNIQRARGFLRENFIFYLAGIMVVLGIKYYYSQAECDSLWWILTPTTRWVELLSGIPFTYVSGAGYVNHSLRMLIAPSCSGVQFMIITIAMLVFSFVHIVAAPKDAAPPGDASLPKDAALSQGVSSPRNIPAAGSVRRVGRGAGWIAACVAFSWLFTVLVNGLRIIVAIYLPLYLDRVGLMREMLTEDRLHTMIGVIVYFTALLMLYRLVDYIVNVLKRRDIQFTLRFGPRWTSAAGAKRPSQYSPHNRINSIVTNIRAGTAVWLIARGNKTDRKIDNSIIPEEQFLKTLARKCMPPIFWYFLMALGLPFLNRASLKGGTKFKEFAILIICGIVLILLPYCILSLLHDRKRCGE